MQKIKKGFSALEAIVIIIIIIGLIGTLGWVFFNRQDKIESTDNVQSDSSQQIEAALKPTEVIAKIKSNWAIRYKLLNVEDNNQPKTDELSIREGTLSPAYKLSGYNYYVTADDAASISALPSNIDGDNLPSTADMELRQSIVSVYQDFGLTKTETIGSKEFNTAEDIYTGRGVRCSVEPQAAGISSSYATCGTISSYKPSAERIKPFAARSIPYVDSSTVFGHPTITDSPVAGYKRAEISVRSINGGGRTALFYKTPGGTWEHFTGTQEVLSCARYNTDDIKKAFRGETCYDTTTNSNSKVN